MTDILLIAGLAALLSPLALLHLFLFLPVLGAVLCLVAIVRGLGEVQ